MEYFDDQEQEISHYRLYCLNTKCKASIYRHPEDIEVPFDAESLAATHLCPCCDMPLVSKMDMEIKKIMSEINAKVVAQCPIIVKKATIKIRF